MSRRERREAVALEADRWEASPHYWRARELDMLWRFKRAQIAAKASDFYLRVLYVYGSVRPSRER